MLLTISRLSCLFEFSVEGFQKRGDGGSTGHWQFSSSSSFFFYIIRMMFLGMLYPHQTYIIYFSSGMECFHPLNLTEDYYPAISFFKKINKFKKIPHWIYLFIAWASSLMIIDYLSSYIYNWLFLVNPTREIPSC